MTVQSVDLVDTGFTGDSRRATAARLTQEGRFAESLPLWRAEVSSGQDGAKFVRAAAVEAMAWRDLTVAGTLAQLYSMATWGSQWYPGPLADGIPVPSRVPRNQVSLPKLRHDIDQFHYLRAQPGAPSELDEILDAYTELAERLEPIGIEGRHLLTGEDEARIGRFYNRLVHVVQAPRTDHALSRGWDPVEVEDRYLREPPGLVVIDGFLSPPALDLVRRFCLGSTVWSGTRYPEGRLGAFFVDGFNAPLLLQIAEEVRAAFPRLIGDHPLRQLWAFKNAPSSLGGANTHADFAAVNVNFWVTPTASNVDPATGGLTVYDVTAPLSWNFTTYNERPDLIESYLREHHARAIHIPYKENRAVVFNSDLFHATEPIQFRPEYEHRRINITMLYGDRNDDRHHPSAPAMSGAAVDGSAWRSSALGRTRR